MSYIFSEELFEVLGLKMLSEFRTNYHVTAWCSWAQELATICFVCFLTLNADLGAHKTHHHYFP
jgi:TRAP-type C4-dicarboxylate transport system permease small subunit